MPPYSPASHPYLLQDESTTSPSYCEPPPPSHHTSPTHSPSTHCPSPSRLHQTLYSHTPTPRLQPHCTQTHCNTSSRNHHAIADSSRTASPSTDSESTRNTSRSLEIRCRSSSVLCLLLSDAQTHHEDPTTPTSSTHSPSHSDDMKDTYTHPHSFPSPPIPTPLHSLLQTYSLHDCDTLPPRDVLVMTSYLHHIPCVPIHCIPYNEYTIHPLLLSCEDTPCNTTPYHTSLYTPHNIECAHLLSSFLPNDHRTILPFHIHYISYTQNIQMVHSHSPLNRSNPNIANGCTIHTSYNDREDAPHSLHEDNTNSTHPHSAEDSTNPRYILPPLLHTHHSNTTNHSLHPRSQTTQSASLSTNDSAILHLEPNHPTDSPHSDSTHKSTCTSTPFHSTPTAREAHSIIQYRTNRSLYAHATPNESHPLPN